MNNSQTSIVSFGTHLNIIIVAYLSGFLSIIALSPSIGLVWAIIFAVGGAMAALPILIIAMILIYFTKSSVENNLKKWCIATPFLATTIWLTIEFLGNYSNRFGLMEYLSLKNVWERALLALYSSSVGTYAYFWLLSKKLNQLR